MLVESKVQSPKSNVPSSVPSRLHRRSLWLAWANRIFHGNHAVCAELAVFIEQSVERFSRARVSSHLRDAHGDYELLEQLRAVSISGEAHPGGHPERAGAQAGAGLRRRHERA